MEDRLDSDISRVPLRIGPVQFQILIVEEVYDTRESFHFLPHNHSRYELQLVVDGHFYVHTPCGEYLAMPGDLCIIHPFEYHTYLHPKDDDLKMTVACCSFDIESIGETDNKQDETILHAIATMNQTYKLHDDSGTIAVLFEKIARQFREHKTGYHIAIKGLLNALIIEVFQLLIQKPPKDDSRKIYAYDANREYIIDFYFLNNYPLNCKIGDLAEQLHLGVRQTSHIIKQFYNLSFSEKLIETRMEIAKLYLLYSEYSVSEIGKMCGFNSSNYFFKTFRKRYDISPMQYRKKTQKLFANDVVYK